MKSKMSTEQKAAAFDDIMFQIKHRWILNVSEIEEFDNSGETDFIEWCNKVGYCR